MLAAESVADALQGGRRMITRFYGRVITVAIVIIIMAVFQSCPIITHLRHHSLGLANIYLLTYLM